MINRHDLAVVSWTEIDFVLCWLVPALHWTTGMCCSRTRRIIVIVWSNVPAVWSNLWTGMPSCTTHKHCCSQPLLFTPFNFSHYMYCSWSTENLSADIENFWINFPAWTMFRIHICLWWVLLVLSQVLITKQDVRDKYSLDNLRSTVEELISMNCIPIINENDVVASPPDLDLDLAGVSTITAFQIQLHDIMSS